MQVVEYTVIDRNAPKKTNNLNILRDYRRAVDRETKKILIAVAVVAIIFLSAYAGIRAYSGVNPPFTVINSGSMMPIQ